MISTWVFKLKYVFAINFLRFPFQAQANKGRKRKRLGDRILPQKVMETF